MRTPFVTQRYTSFTGAGLHEVMFGPHSIRPPAPPPLKAAKPGHQANPARPRAFRVIGLSILLLVATSVSGCVTSGFPFNAVRVAELQPGTSNFSDALHALGAPPAEIYRESSGTYIAQWASKRSIINDGLYFRQSLLLAFDADNRLVRLVDSTHVLLAPWSRTRLLGVPTGAAQDSLSPWEQRSALPPLDSTVQAL